MFQIFISWAKSSAFEIKISLLFVVMKNFFLAESNSIQKSRIKAWTPIKWKRFKKIA